MTRFQRINLWLGLAALALVACMAAGQMPGSLGTNPGGTPGVQAFQ